MKTPNSNLDERQEVQLLNIEKNGCWLAFWALLVSMVVQLAVFGISDFKAVAGEWVVFMLLALYLMTDCIRKGIWDRRMKADPKTNLISSLIAAAVASSAFSFINYLNYRKWQGAIATFVVMSLFLFIACFAALSIASAVYKKQVQKLERESAEASDPDFPSC